MIKEDYCSAEVIKLLKEKGFDIPVGGMYVDKDNRFMTDDYAFLHLSTEDYVKHFDELFLSNCTHQMAMKWLRDKHKIYADPIQQGNYDDNSMYYSYSVAQIIDGRSYIQRPMSVADKFTYEEAVEAALKYSLEKLI